jgi:hypothetical protein
MYSRLLEVGHTLCQSCLRDSYADHDQAIFGLTALWDWFDAGRSETIQELAAPMLPTDSEGVEGLKGAPFLPRAGP